MIKLFANHSRINRVRPICRTADRGTAEPAEPAEPREVTVFTAINIAAIRLT